MRVGVELFFFRRAEGVPVEDRGVSEAVAGGGGGGGGASPCKIASADTPRTNDVLLMDRSRSGFVPSSECDREIFDRCETVF